MYSKNDYRYYLEHRLEESDDYLAHHGVKGMKWKKRKAEPPKPGDLATGQYQLTGYNGVSYRNDVNKQRARATLAANVRATSAGAQAAANRANIRTDNRLRAERKKKLRQERAREKWHKKSEYTNSSDNAHITVTSRSLTDPGSKSSTSSYTLYGQNQKSKDMAADRKRLHRNVDKANPYKYDRNKSLKKNVQNNIKTAKTRKKLKKIADSTVDSYYK